MFIVSPPISFPVSLYLWGCKEHSAKHVMGGYILILRLCKLDTISPLLLWIVFKLLVTFEDIVFPKFSLLFILSLLGDLVIVNMVSFKYLSALASAAPALAAFGVTTSGNNLVVDSGNSNGFSVTVSKSDCSINSIKFRGAEYQYKSQTSHIASGLGSSNVQSTVLDSEYRACVKRCNMLTWA